MVEDIGNKAVTKSAPDLDSGTASLGRPSMGARVSSRKPRARTGYGLSLTEAIYAAKAILAHRKAVAGSCSTNQPVGASPLSLLTSLGHRFVEEKPRGGGRVAPMRREDQVRYGIVARHWEGPRRAEGFILSCC